MNKTGMNETEVIRALGALAQATRLRLFRLLVVAGPAGLTPGQLSQQLAVAPTALSFHLKELSQAGLVQARRNGRSIAYTAAFDTMNGLLGFLTDECCQGQGCPAASGFDPGCG